MVEATVKLDGKHELEQNNYEKIVTVLEYVSGCSQVKPGLASKALLDEPTK